MFNEPLKALETKAHPFSEIRSNTVTVSNKADINFTFTDHWVRFTNRRKHFDRLNYRLSLREIW